ncbi:fimbrial protein, partial [Salmonella enterica subsp. enterica serovar 1,4,[5],12:i:-]|nr:fimbrial protein [Salmonella enterica subsp. enterica serovar 1,4,[5],12:i:-]
VSPSQTFTINVQGCPTAKSTVYSSGVSANVRFTGDADAINSALLRLSAGADSATGLGIEILDNNDVAIAINGESGFRDLVLNENGDANLTFKLRYKSTQENVHAGQAN